MLILRSQLPACKTRQRTSANYNRDTIYHDCRALPDTQWTLQFKPGTKSNMSDKAKIHASYCKVRILVFLWCSLGFSHTSHLPFVKSAQSGQCPLCSRCSGAWNSSHLVSLITSGLLLAWLSPAKLLLQPHSSCYHAGEDKIPGRHSTTQPIVSNQ